MQKSIDLQKQAACLRALAMDAVEKAQSGHPGMPMGMADVASVLFQKHMKFDATDPNYPDRDRFILSAGHGSMLLYGLLYLLGYEEVTLDVIKSFRQVGSPAAGHPEYGHMPGIETTTGPLGQGFANGVGFAIAERLLNDKFGDDLVDHHTYVLAGDGCLMEGISQEALALAGHLGLGKLIVLWDDNGISIDGSISLSDSTNQAARFSASGWHVLKIDGHDPKAIDEALTEAKEDDRPTLIACRTIIGFGAPTKSGKSSVHGAPLGADEIQGTREIIEWPYDAFEIPSDILDGWRLAGLRGRSENLVWQKRLEGIDADIKGEFKRRLAGELTLDYTHRVQDALRDFIASPAKEATRKSSQRALEVLTGFLPEMIGGSADLTGSNLTKTAATMPISKDDYSGRYLYYGIREHAMAGVMNGLTLHGGFRAYGATFLTFADYCRPAIRLSALMSLPVIYVMTHDSIGLGEDGPTHQAVEHLASLRAIPNLDVYRPADVVETMEAYSLALTTDRPSLLAFSRQAVPQLRKSASADNMVAKGIYEIQSGGPSSRVKIFATGTEVSLAIETARLLEDQGIKSTIYSAPCLEHFAEKSKSYRKSVLGGDQLNVVIEAGIRQGWEAIIGADGLFFGVETFGVSGPGPDVYAHFGLTAPAISEAISAAFTESDAPEEK